MKKLIFTLLGLAVLIGCKNHKSEQEENKITQLEQQDNPWEILFDGTSFDNWRGYNTDSMYSEWKIEDSAMVYTPGLNGGKNIITKKEYTNFILSLDWKIVEGGNSGIFWSVFEDPKFSEAYQTGPEIQILDNEKNPDSFVPGGTHKAGSLYDLIACPTEMINPAGEWNLCILEINHKTNLGKVSMNGNEAFTFPVQGEAWDSMITNSKFKGWEGFGTHHTGHIGLQDHGFQVSFRDIKIKEL